MAKGIYVGGSVPKFTTTITTTTTTIDVDIDINNIEEYFDVYHDEYSFSNMQYGDTIFTSNNRGIDYSTAYTTLTALQDMSSITFSYSYASEKNYDKFTLIVAGEVIEDGVSGAYTVKTYSGALAAGDVISFEYAKDSSTGEDYDECDFSRIKIQVQVQVQTEVQVPDGTIDNVARKVIQPYVGVDNVARKVIHGHVGIDNVARRFLGDDITYTTWNKWSCYKTAAYYTEDLSSWRIGETGTSWHELYLRTNNSTFRSTSYEFTTDNGYQTTGEKDFTYDASTTRAEIESLYIGSYRVYDYSTYTGEQLLIQITSIDSFVVDAESRKSIYFDFTYTVVGYADYTPSTYEQGYSRLDTIAVPEGELPESGTLIEGSVDGSYCILKVGSTYYYYERA